MREKNKNIKFRDIRIGFIYSFIIDARNKFEEKSVREKLKASGILSNDEKNLLDFKTCQRFLFSEEYCKEVIRFELSPIEIKLKTNTNITIEGTPILSLFKSISAGSLLINLKLENVYLDDVIFLEQCFCGTFELEIIKSHFITNTLITPKKLVLDYISGILELLEFQANNGYVIFGRSIEIRGMDDVTVDDPERIIQEYSKQIYGLLAADEGWRHVPSGVAHDRLSTTWRTRDYISIVSFGGNILLIEPLNLKVKKGCAKQIYELRGRYNEKVDEYFSFDPLIAGLNHGPLIVLENTLLKKLLLEYTLHMISRKEKCPDDLDECIELRENLIDTWHKISKISITEIDILNQKVTESMGIPNLISDYLERIKEVESILLIRYTEKTNKSIIRLTYITIVVGIIAVLVSIIVGLLSI